MSILPDPQAVGDTASDVIENALGLLFTGTDYSCYRRANDLRTDDLLVRRRASAQLIDAQTALRELTVDWQRTSIPPATREQPFPPQQALDRLHAFNRQADAIGDVEGLIRAVPSPATDAVFERFRTETPLLRQLLGSDLMLVQSCKAVNDAVADLTVDRMQNEEHPLAAVEAAVRAVKRALGDRRALLDVDVR
jgi:hypothetical protein